MIYDAVILGSGLGGLQCAYILAKNGMSVCVLEKNANSGGCLASFKRKNEEFDTGFHYVGALGKGQILERIFSYFGLMELPWHQLDCNGFDEIIIGDKSFRLSCGYDGFAQTLSDVFPSQSKQISAYSSFLKDVGSKITDPLLKPGDGFFTVNRLLSQNAWEYLQTNISDPLLRNILSGNSLKLELKKESLPLYTFAQINSSYIQSAWRLRGSGSMIADSLVGSIRAMGGDVFMSSEVTEIVEKDGRAEHLTVKDKKSGECRKIFGRHFISNLSPELTLSLVKESKCIRPVFRRRILNLSQTYGFFTVNIKLKEGKIPYFNRNFYCYSPDLDSVWDIAEQADMGKIKGILISQQVPSGPDCRYATHLDILAPMSYSEVREWEGTTPGTRPAEYREFKARKAEECIQMAQCCISGLKDAVETCYTSTPLTYQYYTGAIRGTAYGIRKDCNNLLQTLLAPRTPIPNLLLTGQNLNLHGVLGVSITSLMTCSEILEKRALVSFLE